jgi:hypothetical protein
MAEIKSPLTAAMKTRASDAIAALEVDSTKAYSPRKMRAFILRVDDSDGVRAAMKTEGWFEPSIDESWKAASNEAVTL